MQWEAGVGYSAVVQQFVEQIKQYTEQWEAAHDKPVGGLMISTCNKDESNNFDQRHDLELARKSVYPIVEARNGAEGAECECPARLKGNPWVLEPRRHPNMVCFQQKRGRRMSRITRPLWLPGNKRIQRQK
ncbi:unnamed protein product [Effrenium voratum]|nr:unnamed protein product [Effrenium voratum]